MIDVSNAATVAGSSDVPVEMLPAMIVLEDPADSSSVHVFHPEHPELLIPEQAAHLFRNDAARPFRLIVARHSD
jgi:hypothetical protein